MAQIRKKTSEKIITIFSILLLTPQALNGYSLQRHRLREASLEIRGKVATPCAYPFICYLKAILTDSSVVIQCGASLITPETILTAGHCVKFEGLEVKHFEVMCGAHNVTLNEPTTQTFRVDPQFVFPHPDYNVKTAANDVAIVKLPSKASLNCCVNLLRLPSPSTQVSLRSFDHVTVVGWGRPTEESQVSSVPLEATNPLMNTEECRDVLVGKCEPVDIHKNICMRRDHGRGICQGDSGSPFVHCEPDGQWTGVGVVSFLADEGCGVNLPGVATNIVEYLDFIKKHVGHFDMSKAMRRAARNCAPTHTCSRY